MASINSLPPEVTEIIIRRTATSVDWLKFENQLTLTARISSNWTYASQMILHSDLIFDNDEKANKWLKCGIAGKFKTQGLRLSGDVRESTLGEVLKKVLKLESLLVGFPFAIFDMKLLAGERFSHLRSLIVGSELSYKGKNIEPFKFRLSSLRIYDARGLSSELLALLIQTAKYTLHTLTLTSKGQLSWDELLSIIKLENFPRIKSLYLHSRLIPTLALFRELETFHTFNANDEAELAHLEFILSTILPGQLKEFKIELDSDGQIEEEDLESVERMMKLPGLNRLNLLMLKHEGEKLHEMTRLRVEWEKRGVEVRIWTQALVELLNSRVDDSDYSGSDFDSDE